MFLLTAQCLLAGKHGAQVFGGFGVGVRSLRRDAGGYVAESENGLGLGAF